MAGPFAALAGVVNANDQGRLDAIKRQRDEEDRAAQMQQRQMAMAVALAQMNHENIIPNSQRDITQPGDVGGLHGTIAPPPVPSSSDVGMAAVRAPSAALVLPKTPNLTQVPGVDPTRYTALGNSGYSLDESPAPDFAERRALQLHEQAMQRRMATLKAWDPKYKSMPDDALRGVAEDNTTYSEALKTPPAPKTVNSAQGVMRWDAPTQTFVPTGLTAPNNTQPRTINTVDGVKVWNPTTKKFELVTNEAGKPEMPFVRPAQMTPEQPSVVLERNRNSIRDRITLRQRQITALDNAMVNSDDAAAVGTMKTQRQQYADEVKGLITDLDALATPGAKPKAPPAPEAPASTGMASLRQPSTEAVPQTADGFENDPTVQDVAHRVGPGGWTLDQVNSSTGLSAEQKKAIQRIVARRGGH